MFKMKNHQALLKQFAKLYPNPKSELNFHNRYQLLVAVMLSAQCTDKKVNDTTPELFAHYPDFKTLARASLNNIEILIRPINYYKTKARHLIKMANQVVTDYNHQFPTSHEELTTLAGVGRKTANVILSELGLAATIPVDTHVFRVSQRLGIASGKTPLAIEESLKANFKSQDWRNLHHWLIFHGRRVCKAQRPLCQDCTLSKLCPTFKTMVEK